MVSKLNLKKRRKWMLIVLAVLLGLLTFWCNYASQSRNYPYHVASAWQCNNPHFSITYSREENGTLTSYEELEWNNKTMKVSLCFLMKEYYVYRAASSDYHDRLFSGTWKYRNGDLILILDEDFLFGNQYRELVFSPVK